MVASVSLRGALLLLLALPQKSMAFLPVWSSSRAHGMTVAVASCVRRTVLTMDASDPEGKRRERRQARLLGDVGELSSFEELFATLRDEEEAAVAAAEAEGMYEFLEELKAADNDTFGRGERPPRPRGRGRGATGRGQLRRPVAPTASPAWYEVGAAPLYDVQANGPAVDPWGGRPLDAARSVGRGDAWAPDGEGLVDPSREPVPLQTRPRLGGVGRQLAADLVGGQMSVVVPTKVMVFIDGTWLYYQLFGRGRRCEIARAYGEGWWESHHIDYARLPQLISDHLSQELLRTQPYAHARVLVHAGGTHARACASCMRLMDVLRAYATCMHRMRALPASRYAQRAIEVVRVLVYSSFRDDMSEMVSQRLRMFKAMQALNFEVLD